MSAVDRRIPIPGTSNLRDVGGYPTTDGRLVAAGRLFRSEALVMPGGSSSYSIYDASLRTRYRCLGIRTVVDLRAQREIDRARSAWPEACAARLVEFPIAEGGEGADTDYIKMLVNGEREVFGVADMARLYIDMLERRAAPLGAAFRTLGADADLPVLVHCAAGKDRTGVLIALVLSALGVPDDLVIEDYALTGLLRPNRIDAYADKFTAAGRDPEVARVLFESPAAAMAMTLEYLADRFGGAAGYLTQHAQVPEEIIVAVRSNLTG